MYKFMKKLNQFLVSSLAFATMFASMTDDNRFVGRAEAATTNEAVQEVGNIVHVPEKQLPYYESQSIGQYNNYNDLMTAVMNELRQFNTQFSFKFTGDMSNFNASFDGALQEALVQPGNDYIHGTLSTWRYSYTSTGDVTLSLTYVGTYEQEQYVTKRVKEIAAELTRPNMTDFDKVKAVNDYIVTHSMYSRDTTQTPHHIYTFLTEQKAVCQAYALLAYRLFEEMGIESRYVVGYAGELHAWNTVKVDGVWYQLDTTWNDLIYNGGDLGDNIHYRYFLVTNEQLRKDHTWNEWQYPTATDTRYSMYHDMAMGIEYNGDMYYSSATDEFLYKMNKQTGVKERLTTVRALYLAAHNDTIYFSNYSNNAFLSAYNVKTKTLTTIDASPAKNLRIRGNTLQYEVNGQVKTYALEPVTTTTANTNRQTATNEVATQPTAQQQLVQKATAAIAAIDPKSEQFVAQVETTRALLKKVTVDAASMKTFEQLEQQANVYTQIAKLNAKRTTYVADIAAAKAAYNALTKKDAVTNIAVLTAAEQKVQAAKNVMTLINGLKTAKAEDVIAVRAAYKSLAAQDRRYVTNVKDLMAIERKMSRAITAAKRIQEIDPNSTKFKKQVAIARKAVQRVPASQRALIKGVQALEQFEARL